MVQVKINIDAFEQNPNYCLDSIFYGDWAEFSSEMNIKSNYISELDIAQELSNVNNNLSLFSLNTQSLFAKHNDLSCFIYNLNNKNIFPSVLCLQETWISSKINLDYIKLNEYNWTGKNRIKSKGGGIGFYLYNKFKHKELFENYFIEGIFECMCLKISYNNLHFIMINIYRPPHETSQQLEQFFDIFLDLMQQVNDINLPIFICGDINLNIFETYSTSNASRFVDIMTTFGFLNTQLRATRVTTHSFSLIDVFFMKNYIPNHEKSLTIISDISDHFILCNIFKTKIPKQKSNDSFEKRALFEENLRSLSEALNRQNWDEIIHATDVNLAYNKFYDVFRGLYDVYCPKKTIQPKKKTTHHQNHVNDHLLKCRNFKHLLYNKQHKDKSEDNILAYKRYRNELRRCFTRAKQNYFQNAIIKAGKDGRKIWSVLKEALNINKNKIDTEHLLINNVKITDPIEIANQFNLYFTTLGTSLLDQIPITNRNYYDFLPTRIDDTIFIPPLDELTTFNAITSCFPKTSCDANDISMKTIINCAAPLSVPLNAIYNLAISSGTFPEGMKISKCITLFKAGDPSTPDNYRCLSLVNNFSKPLEKIIYNNILEFLEENHFFSDRQFGFRKSISTVHNLLNLSNLIANTQAEGKICGAVLIDIQKCFDTIDHQILFSKLYHYGIRGQTLNLIKSYFSNRKQFVYFKGKCSSLREILLGILQGSVLGPLFFLIFINDIENAIANAIFNLFADDSLTLLIKDNLNDLINALNDTLPHIVQWYASNRLIINAKKTKVIIFTTPRQNFSQEEINLKNDFPVYINTNSFGENNQSKINKLSLVCNANQNKDDQSAKHLGITLDEKMNYKKHFDNLHLRLQKAVFSLKIMKDLLNKRHLKILYSSYCKSIIEYGIMLFTGVNQETLKPIKILQKSCIRIIAKTKNNREPTSPLFKQYGILPVNELMTYNVCKFMHSFKYNQAPKVFNDCWHFTNNVHNYPTRNNEDFATRTNINTYIMNTPLYKFPRIFNNLPANIKNIENKKLFSKKLFTHLINNIN